VRFATIIHITPFLYRIFNKITWRKLELGLDLPTGRYKLKIIQYSPKRSLLELGKNGNEKAAMKK